MDTMKKPNCGVTQQAEVTDVPETEVMLPDANVGMDGSCIIPAHPENARANTGEPCSDGRSWPLKDS